MGIILKPFAWLLLFFYEFFSNYGIALILFAVVIKLVLFPVTLMSKKSMIKTNMLSGKMQKLQKQYGKDKVRYNEEVQKLYEREKVNPMSGCLWSLIPMIVLIGLYNIIREPMTYFMDLTVDQIQLIANHLGWETVAVQNGWVAQNAMDKLLEKVASGELASTFENGAYNQIYLLSLVNESNLASIQSLVNSQDIFILNYDFLGMNLSVVPTLKFWEGGTIALFLLPFLSTLISFISMKVSLATNKINRQAPASDQVERTNNMMMWMMPVMTLWIGFTVPAGLSIYWIAQYIITMGQEVICSKMLAKDYEKARIASEKRELEEKEEEKRRKEEARLERARRLEEEKKSKGKKKPAQKPDDESAQAGVNPEDSREGIRAHARGRAYAPDRFGGVTAYQDPNVLLEAQRAEKEANGKKKKKKKGAAAPAEETPAGKPDAVKEAEAAEAPVQETPAVEEAPAVEVPAQEELPAGQAVEETMDAPQADRYGDDKEGV